MLLHSELIKVMHCWVLIIRLHRMNRGQRCGPLLLMFCGRCLCVSVSPLDITMSCVEIAEPIEMSFGMWTFMVPGSPRGKAILGASPQFGLFSKFVEHFSSGCYCCCVFFSCTTANTVSRILTTECGRAWPLTSPYCWVFFMRFLFLTSHFARGNVVCAVLVTLHCSDVICFTFDVWKSHIVFSYVVINVWMYMCTRYLYMKFTFVLSAPVVVTVGLIRNKF